jgi:hypothetical protein
MEYFSQISYFLFVAKSFSYLVTVKLHPIFGSLLASPLYLQNNAKEKIHSEEAG